MEWQILLLIIGGILFLCLMSGVPIFVAFLIVDTVGILLFMGGLAGIDSLIRSMFDSIGLFTLTPVVLFLIMGEAIFRSGMASRALDVIERVLMRLPGRLSLVAVAGGAIFSTLSGSALGSCAMLGALLVPDMRKRRLFQIAVHGAHYGGWHACGHHSTEHPCCYLRGSGRHIRWEAFACWFYSRIYTDRFLSALYHLYMLSRSIPGSNGGSNHFPIEPR